MMIAMSRATQHHATLPWWAIIPPAVYVFILPFAHTIAIRWIALGMGVVLAIGFRSSLDVPPIPCKLPIILWIGVTSMSLVWAIDFEYSIGQFRVDVGYAIVSFLVLFMLTASARELRILLWSIWSGAVMISGLAIYKQALYGAWIPGYQNFYGEFTSCMLISIPLLPLLLLDQEKRAINRIAVVLAFLLIITACFFAHQRMFWIALMGMCLISSFIYFPLTSDRIRRLLVIASTVLILASLLGFLAVSKMLGSNISKDQRPVIWTQTLKNIEQKPLRGAGFGREVYKSTYVPLSLSGERLLHAHNIFLSYAEQTGIQGAIALIILFGVFLQRFAYFSRIGDVRVKAVGIAGAALVVGVVLKGMTDMHFSREVALFFWATIGMLFGYGERAIRS